MRRIIHLAVALATLASVASGCLPSLGGRKPPVINVVAVSWPGGAPPPVLSLYRAALEVQKAGSADFELKVTLVTPTMPDPAAGATSTPPTVTALEQALGQSPPPDIVLFTSGYEFAAAVDKDLLAPLGDLARGEKALKLDDYYPGAVEAVSDQGKLYAIPLAATPMVLQYDKRLFDAADLAGPDASWNWTALLSAAKTLTRPDTELGPQWGLNLLGGNWLPALIWQNGGEIISKDGRRSLLAEPAAVEAIKFYSDLMHVHKVAFAPARDTPAVKEMVARAYSVGPGDYPPLFGPGGRTAMQLLTISPYGFGPYGKAGGAGGEAPLRIAELPRGKQQATTIDIQATLSLTTASANPKVAFKALAALADEMQKDMVVPANRTAAKRLAQISPGLSEADVKVVLASMEHGRAMPLFRQNLYMQAFYEKLMSPLQSGDKEPEAAAREAAQAIDEALNKPLEELRTPVPASGRSPAGPAGARYDFRDPEAGSSEVGGRSPAVAPPPAATAPPSGVR